MSAEQDRIRHIVLGIGIDVNMDLDVLPADVRAVATTLAREARTAIDRLALLQQLLRELETWYQVFLKNDQEVLREWRALNMTVGNRVTVSGAGEALEGVAQGIDNEGRLIVRLDDGSARTVAAGDVSILKGSRGQ
jgi:BirA family biotin operon repressor/biotin-[acetyl-CoA-carboxylase] ligase